MPLSTEPKYTAVKDNTPAAGLRAQLSPTRFPTADEKPFGQTEPNRNLVINQNEKTESEGQDNTNTTTGLSLDGVKQGIANIPDAAANAAHHTVDFVKHLPEHTQHGAQATAEFFRHVPEHAQHGASATVDFFKGLPEHAQHGLSATSDFMRGLPERAQRGAQVTAEFMRGIPESMQQGLVRSGDWLKCHVPTPETTAQFVQNLPEQAKEIISSLKGQESAHNTTASAAVDAASAGVHSEDKTLQRAAPPVELMKDFDNSPTELEKADYFETIDRSDAEGMNVHEPRGAAQRKVGNA